MQDKERNKTIKFVLVALMAVVVAWEPWRPTTSGSNVPKDVGTKLFPDFKDPLAAKSLEVIRFDEDTATLRPFKVAQVNGVWSIPSHSNYPADAKEHMAQAATALLNVEILNVVSGEKGDQELYGVIAPDPQTLKPGMVGVGTRVVLKNDKDETLADVVIGKEVKEQPAQRYVRPTNRDQIYKVAIKTDKLSTKFEDWIEKDLLKLNAFDVRGLELNDYSTQEGVGRDGQRGLGILQRSKAKLAYDDGKSSWNLLEYFNYNKQGEPEPAALAEDEELNVEKLNGLKTALDDLQIVDVERKPGGLSQDLRASDDFVKNREAVQSLAERGFYPASRAGGELEIFSSEGEATCTTKDGVRYVLRFGQLAAGEEVKEATQPGEKDKKSPALNRYLFVTAQFDDTQIPKPQLEPESAEEKPAETAAPDDQPADKADAKAPAEKATEEKVPEKKTADEEGQPDEPAAPEEKPDQDAEKTEEKPAEVQQEEAAAEKKDLTPEEQKKIAIRKENKRKQDEYNEAIKKGQDKVKELNDRFADWYFIISDDVYKKIHLGRTDFVKKKESKEEKDAVKGGLNDLKQFENNPLEKE